MKILIKKFRVYALLVLLMFGGMLAYRFVFDAFIMKTFVLDSDDLDDVVPNRGRPIYLQEDTRGAVFSSPSDNHVVAVLTPRGIAHEIEVVNGWIHLELYGWVWSESLVTDGEVRRVSGSISSENMRVEANGIITATLFSQAGLEALATSENGAWILCRTRGWIESRFVSYENPSRGWFGMHPVFTVTTRLGGESSKNMTSTTLYESTGILLALIIMSSGLIGSISFRLIRRGKLIGNEIYQQIHKGSGDNVLGDKDTKTEIPDDRT